MCVTHCRLCLLCLPCRTESIIELQVPPDAGNGTTHAGGQQPACQQQDTKAQLLHFVIHTLTDSTYTSAVQHHSPCTCNHTSPALCGTFVVIGAGVSLARLLWHVPVPAMVTLIASLLLERRVLVVGQSRDMVSAAVCAAQALLHPFR